MKKKLILMAVSLTAILSFAACKKTDVVGDASITSFEKVLNQVGDKVSEDTTNGGYSLSAPDGSVRFIWSKDYSQSSGYDVMLELPVFPFIDAGLDTSKLPEGMLDGEKIIVGKSLGDNTITYEGDATPLAAYEQIVTLYRDSIKYHAALDHYGVDLGGGNMFEWAKDMTKNDKDIVYVLNPQPFIDAGVDPSKVAGWVFAKVETMDENGKKIEVDKFLKPFELDGKQ
ncbi:MAG: hypothetical protein K0S47_1810 [Herbinix sp.]|jgi:hypothetical protein|nr:hypothetical protein [Herbinix sp.]